MPVSEIEQNSEIINNLANNICDDILRPITEDYEFEELLQLYRENLPASLNGYSYLKNFIKWNRFKVRNSKWKISPLLDVVFYTNRNGDLKKNGTIVSLSDSKGAKLTNIFVSTVNNPDELRECLLQTKRINWTESFLFPCVLRSYEYILVDVIKIKLLPQPHQTNCDCWALSMEKALDFVYELPDTYTLNELSLQDADRIFDLWPHKAEANVDYVRTIIKINGGFGVYNRNNELSSWILLNENNGLGMLQTIDTEKRNGLGMVALKALCKKIAKEQIKVGDDVPILAWIVANNEISQTMFRKLGFIKIDKTMWMQFNF